MIIQNGHIEFITTADGGIDPDTGHPVRPSGESYGRKIPCQYSALTFNALAKTYNEPYTNAKYSILIEAYPVCGKTERLRLTDRRGCEVGTFSVISSEPLDAVNQIRITV